MGACNLGDLARETGGHWQLRDRSRGLSRGPCPSPAGLGPLGVPSRRSGAFARAGLADSPAACGLSSLRPGRAALPPSATAFLLSRPGPPRTLIVSSWGGRAEGAPGPCIIRGLNGPAARAGRRGAGGGAADPARVWPRWKARFLPPVTAPLPLSAQVRGRGGAGCCES